MAELSKIFDPNFAKVNRERFREMEVGMNQNNATIFLAIGLHFNRERKEAYPCIMGSHYLTKAEALDLLQKSIDALNFNSLAAPQDPPEQT